ncbi:MAG: hypothetical protein R3253_09030 [Longimicrobiales bacterium]|nr:hypothetical protein [Longimicrobiales bacterium]
MESRPDGAASSEDRAWQDSRGLGSRRVRLLATVASVVVHLTAIVLYTLFAGVLQPDVADFRVPAETDSEQGLDVIRLVELDEEPVEPPEEPEELEDLAAAEADVRPPTIAGPAVGELIPPGPTAAERLRPNLSDPRLWARLPDEFYELTIAEREEILLAGRIAEWYDSLAAVAAAEDRLTDWTFRDGEGGRWGVADGKIYLGDVALPLPIAFGTPVGKRDAVNYRLWEFDEIERQSQRFLIEQNWRERAAAIRARRDRERGLSPPDTSGIR